jgi:hypothetical protein
MIHQSETRDGKRGLEGERRGEIWRVEKKRADARTKAVLKRAVTYIS